MVAGWEFVVVSLLDVKKKNPVHEPQVSRASSLLLPEGGKNIGCFDLVSVVDLCLISSSLLRCSFRLKLRCSVSKQPRDTEQLQSHLIKNLTALSRRAHHVYSRCDIFFFF